MLRSALAAMATTAAVLAAPSAQAGVQWSIGINVPAQVVVSSGGGYYAQPAPVYVAPVQEVRYAPAPARYMVPAPVYEAPRVYAPGVYSPPEPIYAAPYRRWGAEREVLRQREWERVRWEREHHRHHHHEDERRW